jgi:hypothetical protein
VEDYFSKITLQLGNVSVFCGGLFFINNFTASCKVIYKNCPPQKTDTLPSCKVIYKK